MSVHLIVVLARTGCGAIRATLVAFMNSVFALNIKHKLRL